MSARIAAGFYRAFVVVPKEPPGGPDPFEEAFKRVLERQSRAELSVRYPSSGTEGCRRVHGLQAEHAAGLADEGDGSEGLAPGVRARVLPGPSSRPVLPGRCFKFEGSSPELIRIIGSRRASETHPRFSSLFRPRFAGKAMKGRKLRERIRARFGEQLIQRE